MTHSIDPAFTDTPTSEAGVRAFLTLVDPAAADAYQQGGYAGLTGHLDKETTPVNDDELTDALARALYEGRFPDMDWDSAPELVKRGWRYTANHALPVVRERERAAAREALSALVDDYLLHGTRKFPASVIASQIAYHCDTHYPEGNTP